MRFVLDEQLPPALAQWFQARGHEAEHVVDIGLLGQDDCGIARHAHSVAAVVVTKDKDYLRWGAALEGLQVLWLRVGSVPNRVLFACLGGVWREVVFRLENGEALVTVWPYDQDT